MDEKTPEVPGGGDQVPETSATADNAQAANGQYPPTQSPYQTPNQGGANQGGYPPNNTGNAPTPPQGYYGQNPVGNPGANPVNGQNTAPYGQQGSYPQPGQAPTAAYPQGAGYGGNGGYPTPQTQQPRDPRKKKRIILISSIAGAVVLLLIIGAVVINVVNSSVYGPQATVQTYLQNLAQGKAGEANKMVSPGDDEAQNVLLTDEVLGEAERITNPKVGRVSSSDGSATAEITYVLDGTTFDGFVSLSQDGKQGVFFDKWKIDEPLVSPLSVFVNEGTKATVNGVEVDFGEESSLNAYPAIYEVGAPESDFFEAETQTITVGTGLKATFESVDLELTATPALTEEVQKQVDAHLDECATATEINPDGCNLRNFQVLIDFLSVSTVAYTVVDYPVVTVDESSLSFSTTGGRVEAAVTGVPFSDGDPGERSYVTNDNWSGYSGTVTIDGDQIVLEFY